MVEHTHFDVELNTGVEESFSKELQDVQWGTSGVWGWEQHRGTSKRRIFIPFAGILYATEYPCMCKPMDANVREV